MPVGGTKNALRSLTKKTHRLRGDTSDSDKRAQAVEGLRIGSIAPHSIVAHPFRGINVVLSLWSYP